MQYRKLMLPLWKKNINTILCSISEALQLNGQTLKEYNECQTEYLQHCNFTASIFPFLQLEELGLLSSFLYQQEVEFIE